MQAVLDLDVLDLAEVAVDVLDERRDVVGPLLDSEVGLQVGALDRTPDAHGEGRQLGGVEHLEPRVFVEQRLELRHLVVGVGAHHRRHQVVDDHRVHAPLGLDALARVVDDEGVDERHVAERGVGRATGRERERLAGQPLERAVLAEVHDRVRTPDALDPPVAGQVVVRRRQLGVVVDPHGIVAVAARRLDRDEHVAELEPGHDEVGAVDVAVARRRAPALLDRRAQRRRQLRVPGDVVVDRQTQRRGRELVVGEELRVVPARRDQRVHELVAVLEGRVDEHAVAPHRVEQAERAGRRVEPDRHADLGVLGREARQQHGDATLRSRQRAQPSRAHRKPGHPRAALQVGHVARDGGADPRDPGVALLERDDAAEQPPVELGDRHLRGRVERRETRGRLLPGCPRRRRRDRLDDGDAEAGQRRCVPLLPGLAHPVATLGRDRVARARASGGEHRDDQRVDAVADQLQRGHAPVGVAPQGVAPDGQRVAAGLLDRGAERIDEGRVAGQPVRAVEADADRRALGIVQRHRLLDADVAGAGNVDAEIGDLARRREAVALEQERVGEEAQQLLDVVDVAVAQVLAGLRDRARGCERECRHLGVGLSLAAKGEQRDATLGAAGAQEIEAALPPAPPPEDAAQHDAGAHQEVVDQRRVVGRGSPG